MCGIAGVFSRLPDKFETGKSVNEVSHMVRAIDHRGPDDKGIWADPKGRLIIGHCRLAIVDLTLEGHQPMTSSCGRYVISFNDIDKEFVFKKALFQIKT